MSSASSSALAKPIPASGRESSQTTVPDVPFLGEIPLDPKVVVGGDTGEPIVVAAPDSVAALAFRELARQVVEQVTSGHAGHNHAHGEHDHAHAH